MHILPRCREVAGYPPGLISLVTSVRFRPLRRVARFYYARTKKVVDIPEDRAHIYENRRHYQRLDDPITVPEGSVAEVLQWVGDDPARRRAALEAERRGKARMTLIEKLR